MEVYSTDISAVRLVDNKVVTLASNNLNQSHFKTAASIAVWRTKSHHPSTISYKTVQWAHGWSWPARFVSQQLTSLYWTEKWYWMQLINFVRHFDCTAWYTLMKRFLNWDLSEILHGNIFKIKGPQKTLMKRFLNWDLSEILYGNIFKIKCPQNFILPDIHRLVQLSANNHVIASFTQGRYKICKKNTTKGCKECNIRLRKECNISRV